MRRAVSPLFAAAGLVVLLRAFAAPPPPAEVPPTRFASLWGWVGTCPPESVSNAAVVGFTDLLTWTVDPQALGKLVPIATQYGMGVYSTVGLSPSSWKKDHPEIPAPLQELNSLERQALASFRKNKGRADPPYQHGGEPIAADELLLSELLCFHHPEVVEAVKGRIREVLQVPGLRGVAFDGIGYQNYRCCRCAESERQLATWQAAHPDLSEEKAREAFSLETLVDFQNDLAAFARGIRPDILTGLHIWPVYAPEPLYGNHLDVDFCGQTAAWYMLWDLGKVRDYARLISGEEKKHHPRSTGVAMIGYYGPRSGFPFKSPARVEAELQAILEGGCRHVQVCGLKDVLKEPEIAAVFRKYAPRP
jgi:hypothetical protein